MIKKEGEGTSAEIDEPSSRLRNNRETMMEREKETLVRKFDTNAASFISFS